MPIPRFLFLFSRYKFKKGRTVGTEALIPDDYWPALFPLSKKSRNKVGTK